MKTFVFAGSLDEAKEYRNRNCLFSADMLLSDYPLIGIRECELHLVGTYQRNPVWESVRKRVEIMNLFNNIQIHTEEWYSD